MENRLNDKQQCLDYLGDNEELSPAQICKKSSQSIETKLKTLRLRHCCERTVGSALHNAAYADVLYGGTNCTGRLAELLETDALAARITCEFTEVLIRYDCGQPYSIIHHCEDCKYKSDWLFRPAQSRLHGYGGTMKRLAKDNRSSNAILHCCPSPPLPLTLSFPLSFTSFSNGFRCHDHRKRGNEDNPL
uniref:Uncharacterized protein n=1 Tax=Anopheles culicifacies TaxID=139723 RepID=A0A182M605_9DIPT